MCFLYRFHVCTCTHVFLRPIFHWEVHFSPHVLHFSEHHSLTFYAFRLFKIILFYFYSLYIPIAASLLITPSTIPTLILPPFYSYSVGAPWVFFPLPWHIKSLPGWVYYFPLTPDKAAQLQEHIPLRGSSFWDSSHSSCSESTWRLNCTSASFLQEISV